MAGRNEIMCHQLNYKIFCVANRTSNSYKLYSHTAKIIMCFHTINIITRLFQAGMVIAITRVCISIHTMECSHYFLHCRPSLHAACMHAAIDGLPVIV